MDKGKIDHPFCAGRESVYTSELERLSSDPALTRHPNPKFQAKFRDPDELYEEEPTDTGVVSSGLCAQPYRTGWELRRSPKE